jgi:hypothetical protein
MAPFTTLLNKNPSTDQSEKLVQLITWGRPASKPKFIIVGEGVEAPHVGKVVDWRSFNGVFSSKRTAKDVSPRSVIDTSNSVEDLPPKNPSLSVRQPNRLREYLGAEETVHNA